MAKMPQSKDEALEALDFIVNVLKEHEKDLDKLIGELATVTEQLGVTGDLGEKIETIEEKITSLQKEVSSLMSYLSGTAIRVPPSTAAKEATETVVEPAVTMPQTRPSVILKCKQWEDFQSLAFQAQTLSFAYKEEEKIFQADALKSSQIITYSGPLPKSSCVIKAWLSKELSIPEKNILEGVLAIG